MRSSADMSLCQTRLSRADEFALEPRQAILIYDAGIEWCMSDHANPFRPGPGLQPPYLAGRDGDLARFSQMLQHVRDGQVCNLVVHGPCNMGKTALLKEFTRICIDKKFLSTMLRFSSKHSDPAEFTRALQHALDGAMAHYYKTKKTGDLQDANPRIRPQQNHAMEAGWEFDHDPACRVPLEDQISSYLESRWEIMRENDCNGIVLFFDDFHTVDDVESNRWYMLTDFIGAVNKIQSNECRYSLVLCGLPSLVSHIMDARPYAERMFDMMSVSYLDRKDAKTAISGPLEGTAWHFSDDLVLEIVRDTGSCPYLVQFFCRGIISRVSKGHVALGDYIRIRDQLTGDLVHDFERRIGELSAAQRRVLYHAGALADPDLEFSSLKKSLDMSKGSLSNHLRRLEEKGLIYKSTRGVYRLAMPMLGKYMRLDTKSE